MNEQVYTFKAVKHGPRYEVVDRKILVIEYQGDKVFSVVSENGYYDFDWCQRDGCYYHHLSGFGRTQPHTVYPGDVIWAAQGVAITCEGDYTRLEKPPLIAEIIEMLESCSEHDTVYCSICDDHFPDEDLCEHTAWCDECGIYTTPDEKCEHTEQEGSHHAE